MIDLHLHTTASDGLLHPDALMAQAAGAGLTVVSVTDHDTVAGIAPSIAAANRHGLRVVSGIEITAVEQERDVHVLGYFFDPSCAKLSAFLDAQRQDRMRRVRDIGDRLRDLGASIDVAPLLARAEAGASVGRPAIADALVASGHAADRHDAFARLLGRGRPAFVPRQGVAAAHVIEIVHGAGGIASLAHPVLLERDDLIPGMVAAGLDAIEVWHSDQSPDHSAHYGRLADRLGIAMSGGSDYHGDGVHRACRLGAVALPASAFARLESLAGAR